MRHSEQSRATPGIPAEAILDPPTTPSQDLQLAADAGERPAEPRRTAQLTCKLEGSVNAYRFKALIWGLLHDIIAIGK